MRIVLAGGGTGGHLYPALSLARALSGAPADPGVCSPAAGERKLPIALESAFGPEGDAALGRPAILLIGARGGAEAQLFAQAGLPSTEVASAPLERRLSPKLAIAVFENALGSVQAWSLLHRFRPDLVIATGGYACAPVVVAAAWLRSVGTLRGARIVLLEPNVQPGLANRVLGRVADEVWGAYEETAGSFPTKFLRTGTPVRPEFYSPPAKAEARRRLGLEPNRSTVLVFGGSQGARTLNVATSAMVARRHLPAGWQVLHIAGKRDFEWMAAERKAEPNDNRYVVLPYLEEMAVAFAAADLAVSRAGASSIAELAVAGLPSILVPYPYATEEHQLVNARLFASRGAAIVVEDSKLGPDVLYWRLQELMESEKLALMSAAVSGLAQPRALHLMVERILTFGV